MSDSTSAAAFFDKCVDDYNSILDSTMPSASDEVQGRIREVSAQFDRLMQFVRDQGVMSRNESTDDMSTQALGLIVVPYYLGQLAARRVLGGDHRRRVEVLEVSNRLLKDFLSFCENIDLISEDDLERRLEYRALDRTARVEAHRRKKDLSEKLRELDGRISYERAKARRMRRLEDEADADAMDVDDAGDDGDDMVRLRRARAREAEYEKDADRGVDGADDLPDEVLRERHIVYARLCIEEAFESIHMNSREAEMLGSMTDEEKAAAVAKYQEALKEDRTHMPSSTLHFPGAQVPDAVDPELARLHYSKQTGPSGAFVQVARSGTNYRVAGCGHTAPLREQVRDDTFRERNAPTQTLEEFAEQETAFVQEQMRLQAEAMMKQKEEDDRLGAEGIEERERQKAAAWADWKDDNPPVGITNKGNYS